MSKRNRKKDQIKVEGKLDNKTFKQNPNWYFKDAVQADVLSRIQMNAFGAITKIFNSKVPTVCAFYTNPCPGVTPFGDDSGSVVNEPNEFQSKGVNRAAQKLWYLLTCKSGRAAGYTKADVALLLLAIGAMIETYEFIRRAFGIAYTYNQRNRALPTMLYHAMCVDMNDYQANAAGYLKRMNSLMAIMNQLPIPGNVAWFAKCQDIYQNIYMDFPAEMAQLFVISPSTTWVLEENDGFIGGSYLRTVDMCVQHETGTYVVGTTNSGGTVSKSNWSATTRFITSKDNCRKLSEYIDVFEEQINNLLFSSSFSQIYADILRAFDNGTLSRWSFDYIDEKYIVTPVFDDNRLWMIHNASACLGVLSEDRTHWQGHWLDSDNELQDYEDIFCYGTPLNDVYQWAKSDTVMYNPTIQYKASSDGLNQRAALYTDGYVIDFPNDNPSVEERVEYTRYCITGANKWMTGPSGYYDTIYNPRFTWNIQLPDHWFELCEVSYDAEGEVRCLADDIFQPIISSYSPYGQGNNLPLEDYTKFHHMMIDRGFKVVPSTGNREWHLDGCYGELTSWATIDHDWFNAMAEMIYVDLFDIR